MSCRYEIFSYYMVLKISFYSATHLADRETQRDSSSWKGPYIVPDFLVLMATTIEVFTGAVMDIFLFLFLHFFSLSDALSPGRHFCAKTESEKNNTAQS